ncbi:RNA ligase [Cyathus striatus]|nr:RNA ligase [Cyathus striatus]
MASEEHYNPTDSGLIVALKALSKKSPKLVKAHAYSAPGAPEVQVSSWKMNEFKYYDIPSPFPTLARGLFTVDLQKKDDEIEDRYRIVVRGYDKFFNIGEVPWTTWPALEAHTAAPYTLSLKSNGCIIFIAALTPEKLIVTSKHSLGPVAGSPLSHAQAGEQWLHKYLDAKKREEKDLAKVLWDNNWTAIAELCDDNFEEHVLPYPPEKTGLHLHGLNKCSKDFDTMPTPVVDAFAEEWGFIKTPTHVVNSIEEVQAFTQTVSEAGEWNGEAVEGFVVRTHVTEPPTEGAKASKREGYSSMSPYAPGSSFFFKVKFDEPYMMYRDWREVTKSLLSAMAKGSNLTPGLLPKGKMSRPETKVYVNWVIKEIKKNPQAFESYSKGKGIISTREKFLKWLEGDGKNELEKEESEEHGVDGAQNGEVFGKTIIVPIAIPGCGKTAVAVSLKELFGFAHTQSDDVLIKKAGPAFIKNVTSLLEMNDVVIADKNNHLKMHRQALRDATTKFKPPVRLLALDWNLSLPPATIHRICADRVADRGERHQSLRPDTEKSHEEVLWMFINTSEELAPSEVDACVDMDIEENLEQMVTRAATGIAKILKLQVPSEAKIKDAVAKAQTYTPTTRKEDKDKSKKSVRYYALLPEVDLEGVIDGLVKNTTDDKLRAFWNTLKNGKRVTERPHVTIVHSKNMSTEHDLWNQCETLYKMTTTPLFSGELKSLVYNDRVMAFTVENLQEGHQFVSTLPHEVRERLHITVGTKDKDITPIEAKDLVEGWKRGEKVGVYSVTMKEPLAFNGRVKGMMG